MAIPRQLRLEVERRAGGCCEYCRLPQAGQEARFHIDHIVPVADDGPTTFENLALACVSCSLRKGARRTAVDPDTSESVPLFHPVEESWADHFEWNDVELVGKTPTGRATIVALKLNRELILQIRREEILLGRFPEF